MKTMDAVMRGAALLDERLPGWRSRVRPDALDLRSGCNCVLGQVLGDYTDGAELLGLSDDELRELGFYASRGKWSTLTNAWRKLLTQGAA